MSRYVSLLRGVNVSGQRKIRMPDLRDLYVSLGHEAVETYVQSGNVVYSPSAGEDPVTSSSRIRAAIAAGFGHDDVEVIVRDADDLAALVGTNPFLARGDDPAGLHVTFLAADPGPNAIAAIDASAALPDEFAPGPRDIYVFCAGGYGRTKLSNSFFERRLRVAATTRNWRTVTTLLTMSRG